MAEKSKLNVWIQGEKPDGEPVDEHYEGSSVICLVANETSIEGMKGGTFEQNLALNYIHALQEIIDELTEEFPLVGLYTKLEKVVDEDKLNELIERIAEEDE